MRTNQAIPTADIVNLAELVLRNNNFEFVGKHFLQKRGTAIGTRMAPAYANIFMHMWLLFQRRNLPASYPTMLRAEVIIYYNYWSSSKPIVFCLQLYHRMSPPYIIIMGTNESNNSWRSIMFLFKVTVT